jgi:hypothetical protein
LRELIGGRDRKFRVRQSDEFKHLEDLAAILRPLILSAMDGKTVVAVPDEEPITDENIAETLASKLRESNG